jgi:hypothetical protein
MHFLVLWPAFGIENMRLPDTLEKVGAQLAWCLTLNCILGKWRCISTGAFVPTLTFCIYTVLLVSNVIFDVHKVLFAWVIAVLNQLYPLLVAEDHLKYPIFITCHGLKFYKEPTRSSI